MDEPARAYLSGLKMLARRELSEAQLRARLARRQFESQDIDRAVDLLRQERALDDRRTAVACARTEVRIRQRGRARVVRQIEAMGIARDVARAAVNEVFAELDETMLLEQALDKRLRRGITLDDAPSARRVFRYLVGQGFDADRISAAVQSRIKNPESRIDR
jgi:regulatory protein